MANDGTISSKLQLDGEQQYKKALNDAYRSLRVLRSELKAETAELGRNASSQDKARTKMQSLQKQIQQQEKIVRTLEKALADSRKEYADNQEVQDKWAEKLNKAREALANMKNQMEVCEDGLSKFGDSMKGVSDSSGQALQTVVSFNDAMKSIGQIASGIGNSLSGIFSASLDTMKEMVDEMLSLMSQAWAAAGEWKEIQTIWGGDLESIEKVYTAMGLQGIDASTVTSGIQKFITNVHNGNADTMAALEKLHLTEEQFSSHWDFFVAVMDKASMFKGQEQYDLMTSLFGDKKGAGMTNMLKNWREAMNRYEKDIEETGMELSSPQIEALDQVAHKITEIQELWNSIKTNIGAKLSEILNMDQLSEDTLEILRDIGSILNSKGETRAELVLKLSDDIEALIKDISAAMGNLSGFLKDLGGDLKKSDNPLVQFIGQLIEGLGGLLDWLAVHGTEITSFLEKALPWILQNKILEATTGEGIGGWAKTLMDLGLNVATLTTLGKALGKGAATEATAAGTTIGTSFLAKLGAGLPEVLVGALLAVPILDLIQNPDKYLGGYDLNGGLPDNIGHVPPSLRKPLKEMLDRGKTGKTEEASSEPGEGIVIPTKRTPNGKISGWEMTQDQVDALENFWDIIRQSDNPTVAADLKLGAFMEEFAGMEDVAYTLYELMMHYGEVDYNGEKGWTKENVPESWYQIVSDVSGALKNLNNDKYTGNSDENLPGKIGQAVGAAVNRQPVRVVVQLDGQTLMDYVDRNLGGQLSRYMG